MFKQLSDKVNYHELESQILAWWEQKGIFAKSVQARAGRPTFTFYEGPPTANGRPGIHHVLSRTLKDLVCRYKTMTGYQVSRKAGWDTHGLPVEIEVEKMLGMKHKDEIVEYGIAQFNAECRKSVWKYKSEWEQMTRMMGYWVDLQDPYVTFENSYMESVWWALKQFYDKGAIFKGYKIQPYCPRCETPLSSHEVSLGYKDVKDPSVYIKLKVKGEENTFFLVWTTTPWTLISNVALAVHPEVTYVRAEKEGERLILAEARLAVLGEGYAIIDRFKGSALVGKQYERMYAFHEVKEPGWYVIGAEFVTTDDGSGIVHMAPAYGEDDYQAGLQHGLPTIHPVNKSGEFGPEVTPFAGKFVKDADAEIIADLKKRGILFKKESTVHSYPHCWRCSSPLLYYARESWYIRTTDYVRRMAECNGQINWVPPEVGTGRFGNWLAENKDWALSRDRFWGTPLPIWLCPSCGKQKCIGSIEELRSGSHVPDPLDLHKPFVDEVTFACSCGADMRRTPELIDVWFDSGAMPFAQWHYPFENKERFEAAYPADYISEGIDQTRGWFYTLHAIGVFLFDKPAYTNVLVHELILDKQGQKMSKSKKNTVDPFALIAKYGADATRWYLVSSSPVWRPTLFDEEGIAEVQRKFFSTLVNTYAFFALYANVDGFTNAGTRIPVAERPEMDRWILSELHSLLRNHRQWMEQYEITRSARAVSEFTLDKLSNWYVRRNRRRFWKSEPGSDKTMAYQTLYECLATLSQIIAPLAPFLAEELYRSLTAGAGVQAEESVHLTMLPMPDEAVIDRELEQRMELAMTIVGLARSMRVKSNLKVRQPLKRIIVPVSSEAQKEAVRTMESVILEELNVKALEFVTEESGIVRRKAKPNFKTLGPKFGKSVQAVAARIRESSNAEISTLLKEGSLTIQLNGADLVIDAEDVEILHEDIEGWLVESDGAVTVALDTELTDELVREGLAREFVNRVQNMRKESGFAVTDRVTIYHRSQGKLAASIAALSSYIQQETLATEICLLKHGDASPVELARAEINGEQTELGLMRAPLAR